MNCCTFLENKAFAPREKTLFIDLDFLNSFFARWCISTKKFSLLILIFIIFSPSIIVAQSYNFCGVFPPHEATSSNLDSIIFDRYGNSYDLDFFQTSSGQRSVCGYFDLDFHDIDDSLQNTICEVFDSLSEMIEMRENLAPCGEYAISGNIYIYIAYDSTITYPVFLVQMGCTGS